MVTRIKNINSFLLNCYIDKINEFIGEEVISHTNEEVACDLNNDTFEFVRKLAERIAEVQKDKTYCVRNCCFRKIKK